ncbi:MAG: DUF6694 family lipoprotein [Pseudomonadota bacterium]
MRSLFTAIVFLFLTLISIGCSTERSINASNDRTLLRSVKTMKEYLPSQERVEFEVAFWTLKESASSAEEFRDVVDGKTASELIALAKKNFAEQQAAGFRRFQTYPSWEAMIEKFVNERNSYARNYRQDKRDKRNTIHGL